MPLVGVEPVRSIPDEVPSDDRTLGWQVLAWSADNLLQPDGPSAGEAWRFTPEQVRFVLRWYAVDERGRFVFRRGVLRRMKGWGKDPVLGVLSAVELCGPCRFDGWDARGLPVAAPHPAPWVQIAAVSKDQTRNTMTLFPGLFTEECKSEHGIDLGKEIIHTRAGGRIEAVTSSPRALEGGRPTLVVLNESHHWLVSNEGLEMADAIRRNLGKSRDGSARSMEITNAHLPGEASVAEMTYEAWRAGQVPGLYYDATEAPLITGADGKPTPVADLSDEEILAGLVAARGDSVWLDVERLLAEIRDPVTSEAKARRFYFNQVFEAAAENWLPSGAWAARESAGPVPDGVEVVLGVDGSYNNDATGIIVASRGYEPHLDVVGCWERPVDAPEDWTVPVLDVEDTIRAACKRWRVREVCFDPYRFKRSMEVLAAEGIPVVEFPQSPERMIPATQRLFEAVVNAQMTHSGDARLARHVGNVVVKEDSRGRRIRKETKWSPRKIDLAVAAVLAYDRAALRRPAGGREWLESLAGVCEACAGPMDRPGTVCTRCSEAPEPVVEQTQVLPADQTRAALSMLRQFGVFR